MRRWTGVTSSADGRTEVPSAGLVSPSAAISEEIALVGSGVETDRNNHDKNNSNSSALNTNSSDASSSRQPETPRQRGPTKVDRTAPEGTVAAPNRWYSITTLQVVVLPTALYDAVFYDAVVSEPSPPPRQPAREK